MQFFLDHVFLMVVLTIAIVGGVAVFFSIKNKDQNQGYTILDYLLVWPVLFKIEDGAPKKTSKRFIIVGVLVAFVLIFIGVEVNKR